MKKLKLEELGRRSVEEYKQIEKLPLIIILDDIRSAYNVGAVFRSSDAFMVDRLCLCGITAKPPNREIHKTALGANESVEWTAYDSAANCISSLKEEGYQVLAVEQTAESIPLQGFKIKVSKKYALVFGNEVQGIGQEAL
ncbi:MAG: TrmH family RNA methyltransferase, partial [Bacteroidetes bacterium]|nr:TrmH family RNA methyltransferase [Bacteroidota bacterium]